MGEEAEKVGGGKAQDLAPQDPSLGPALLPKPATPADSPGLSSLTVKQRDRVVFQFYLSGFGKRGRAGSGLTAGGVDPRLRSQPHPGDFPAVSSLTLHDTLRSRPPKAPESSRTFNLLPLDDWPAQRAAAQLPSFPQHLVHHRAFSAWLPLSPAVPTSALRPLYLGQHPHLARPPPHLICLFVLVTI